MSNLLRNINVLLQRIENAFPILFGKFPPPNFGILGVEPVHNLLPSNQKSFTLKDLIGDGFLWAVPKHRRTIEKRLKRKYGSPYFVMKTLQPKKFLIPCSTCGNHHENGFLCPHCYDKVRKETELIKEQIQEKLKLDPVENDVVVLYDGEKGEHASEFWEGKRIVEMKKPRPTWFSKNLLQKSTQQNATTTEVKKNEDLS